MAMDVGAVIICIGKLFVKRGDSSMCQRATQQTPTYHHLPTAPTTLIVT
jgi:hypothetical protein